jgi:hypothetical protein
MVQLDLATFRQTRWYEYAARFLFGGLITALTGIVAKRVATVSAYLTVGFSRPRVPQARCA